jgi:AdoMet-dependent rRNA methyltransferase SPB1
MGKKTKTGKGRLDKFYHLAKEQGFRARSAFKLTQLAKQYNLFAKTNVCVDLCGAPGGWSQVAVQAMPRGSKVICVDLVPIKPIKGVITIQSDITTQTCRNLIKQELDGKSHICDIVLNDGAPNVGAAWSKDAYNQAELTLHAFQLACDLLRPGGTFVTKVFRSADYNSLLWAFQQLFRKVESTKPSASRAVSAEIFVVCQGYKAPTKVDPKFFNPKFVFMNDEAELEGDDALLDSDKPVTAGAEKEKPSSLSTLLKAMAKRNRSGYSEGDDYRTVSVDEFLASRTPAELLVKCHKILVPSNTSVSVPESLLPLFEDLKVQGKGELYSIMKWRSKVLSDLRASSKINADEEDIDADASDQSSEGEEAGEEAEFDRMVQAKKAEERRELKRQRAKEKKALMRKKMSLDGGSVGIAETTSASFEPDLFHLPTMKERAEIIATAMEDAPTAAVEDEIEVDADLKIPKYEVVERNSEELLRKYEEDFAEEYAQKKNSSSGSGPTESVGKKTTRRQKHMAAWAAEVDALGDDIERKAHAVHATKRADDAPSSDEDDDEDVPVSQAVDDYSDSECPALVPVAPAGHSSVLASRWFSNPIFASGQDEEPESVFNELDEKDLPVIPMSEKQEKKRKRKEKQGLVSTSASTEESGEIEIVPTQQPPSLDEIAEVQALGSLLVHKKSRRELIEAGFNRNVHDDPEDLPDWFIEEEKRYNQKQLPLTKELMAQYRAKLREINARPIRKEAEAVGRRKRRMQRKLTALQQQANSLVGDDDGPGSGHGSIHKAKQIAKGFKAAKRESKRKTVFMAVQHKGGPGKQVGGEGGRGAKVAMVDRRLKKDRRAQRNASRRKKGGRR